MNDTIYLTGNILRKAGNYRFSFFILSLVLFISLQDAQATTRIYQFDKTCQLAYYKMLSLHFEEGKQLLDEERKKNPDNLIPDFVENYADFFTISIGENNDDLIRLTPNRSKRLSLMQEGPKNSPWYLYTQAEINLQWAFANLKFENYYTAFFQIKKAYSGLKENEKLFPGFIANKKSLGLIHALIGTVPDSYKWAANILGFSGTITQGMGELDEVMAYADKTPFLFYDETRYLYIFMDMTILNNPQAASKLVQQAGYPDIKTDPLACFVAADVAIKNTDNEKAISILTNTAFSDGAYHFTYLDYLLGLCKMDRMDDDADVPLLQFVKDFKGINYLKDVYKNLAWYYYLRGNQQMYKYYMAYVKTLGGTFTDSDKQAMKEATDGVEPNLLLLKVRLLQDGGYYEKALGLLNGKTSNDFTTVKDKIEFSYRAGRIYQEWNRPDDAIPYYESTIAKGEKYTYYFAANAALQLGFIYEKKGDKDKAIVYYKKCLAMKNTEYKNSLDQKAKAGLSRLAG